MTRHIAGFLILHVIGGTGIYALWRMDLLAQFYAQDSTGLVALITIVACIGILCVTARRWGDVELIRKNLPTAGLLGTVIGISMAIAGLSESFDVKLLGLHTAFSTTLVALVGHLWLIICERVLKP